MPTEDENASVGGAEDNAENTGEEAKVDGKETVAAEAEESEGKSDDGASEEEKSEDDKSKSKDEDKSEEDDKSEGAPDEYADFAIPEGMQVDKAKMATFTDFAREHELSQEGAQKLVDLHAATISEAAAQQQEKWDEIKEDWRKETIADKTLHDEEGKADAAIAASRKAVEKIGGQPLMDALDLTGAGNHPAVVAAFHKISKALAEDQFVFGSGSADNLSPAQKLYPSMK